MLRLQGASDRQNGIDCLQGCFLFGGSGLGSGSRGSGRGKELISPRMLERCSAESSALPWCILCLKGECWSVIGEMQQGRRRPLHSMALPLFWIKV